MRIFKEYFLSPIALVLIIIILIISGVTRKNSKKITNHGVLAVSMIALGIIFSGSEEWISYIFYGIGVAASVMGFIKNKNDNKVNKENPPTDK